MIVRNWSRCLLAFVSYAQVDADGRGPGRIASLPTKGTVIRAVAALTNGRGADAAFDPLGAAHLRQSVHAVRPGGAVVGYGFYSTANRGGNIVLDVLLQYLQVAVGALPPTRKHITFYDIRPLAKKRPDWFRQDLTALFDLLAAGKLQPVIAARLPLDEVVHAHEQVEHAAVQGKLVLIPNP